MIRQNDVQPRLALSSLKKKLISTNPHTALYALLVLESMPWNFAVRKNPKDGALKDMMSTMKVEGYKFTVLRESDAMVSADTAIEWADGHVCHRCRITFSLMHKHHCRACGQVFCGQCMSKTSTLPKYGIEKEIPYLRNRHGTWYANADSGIDLTKSNSSPTRWSGTRPDASTCQRMPTATSTNSFKKKLASTVKLAQLFIFILLFYHC
ncbi:hypothetical protein JTB14_020392 [Gonioctena quinquepunctata]|nr:hypothetical protein JTB14_020392 [Gonioctena quinquepunctata]